MNFLHIPLRSLKSAPRNVKFAALLIAAGILHSMVLVSAAARADLEGLGQFERYFPVVIGISLTFYLLKFGVVFLMLLGRNWARIMFIAVCILGIPGAFRTLGGAREAFNADLFDGLSVILAASIDYIALLYLLTRPAREWFRKSGRTGSAAETEFVSGK